MAIQSTPYDYSKAKSAAAPLGGVKPVAVGPAPTPYPPQGASYTPQYSGGQMFSTPNPQRQSTPAPVVKPTAPYSTPQMSSNNGLNGFDMKYYPGWNDVKSAQDDWIKTGGAKGRMSVPGTNNIGGLNLGSDIPAPDPVQVKKDNISTIATTKGPDVALDYATNYADTMSSDQYLAMIDEQAGNNMNFLNTQEQNVRAEQPGIEQNLLSQYNASKGSLIGGKEDALSASRRLYSELQQGYKQRFGGASSAGEAATALTGNEQQRQMAQTNRSYMDSMSQLDNSKNTAMTTAQSEFRNRLMEIDKNRVATESERLNARRQALSELSSKAFAIQQQHEQFKQQLDLMKAQAEMQNQKSLSSLTTNPSSTLTYTGDPAVASGNQGLSTAVGYINPSGMQSNSKDLLSQGVYPIQSVPGGKLRYSDGSVR